MARAGPGVGLAVGARPVLAGRRRRSLRLPGGALLRPGIASGEARRYAARPRRVGAVVDPLLADVLARFLLVGDGAVALRRHLVLRVRRPGRAVRGSDAPMVRARAARDDALRAVLARDRGGLLLRGGLGLLLRRLR